MIEVRQTEVFQKWIDGLRDSVAVVRIAARIDLLRSGHRGDHKTFEGLIELRINQVRAIASTRSSAAR